jgi:hypothetical protein
MGENSMTLDPEIKKQFKIIRKNQKTMATWMMILFVALAFMIIFAQPVQAGYSMTLTMSNPSGITERDIIVYFPNGTMQGYYNSTSVITLDTNESYIMAMKPLQSNPMEDPGDWLTNNAIPFVTSNVTYIVIMVFLAMLWLGRK